MTWTLTATGRQHYLAGPKLHSADNAPGFREIAHSLAQINRFTGHATRPYSVAEHSLLVCSIAAAHGASESTQLCALMHDAHECVTGDVASPIKEVVGEAWQRFEDEQQRLVLHGLGLGFRYKLHKDFIKACDLIALATERRDVTKFDAAVHDAWPIIDTPGKVVEPWPGSLNNKIRTVRRWSDWATEFERKAIELKNAWKERMDWSAA